jgi:hypothetical protein
MAKSPKLPILAPSGKTANPTPPLKSRKLGRLPPSDSGALVEMKRTDVKDSHDRALSAKSTSKP